MKHVTLPAFFFIISQGKLLGVRAHTSAVKSQINLKLFQKEQD